MTLPCVVVAGWAGNWFTAIATRVDERGFVSHYRLTAGGEEQARDPDEIVLDAEDVPVSAIEEVPGVFAMLLDAQTALRPFRITDEQPSEAQTEVQP